MTTGLSTLDNLEVLRKALAADKVSEHDRSFAESLVKQATDRGLSQRQWYWVGKLADRARGESSTVVVGDFSGVYALFQRAKSRLKNPKIRLQDADGQPLQLYLAGERSRFPNVVNVTNGEAYGSDDNRWYGRVAPDGKWTPNDRLPPHELKPVAALLRRLADDPEGVASEYGRLTGLCCFCFRKLSDERSTAVGYGPQCAERYGLSWGSTERKGANPTVEPEPDEANISRRVRVRRAVTV